MEEEQVVLEKIQLYMNDRKPELAFKKLMEFIDKYPESPNIYLACAGLLIDCGTILKKSDAVEKGILLIENSLQNVDLLDEKDQLNLQYNLSNGYGTQAELLQSMGNDELSQEAFKNQKAYLQKILLKKDKIDSELLVKVINNYANCLDHLGRTVEAVDQYYDCLMIDPDHAVAMGNCSHALQRLFNISTKRNDKLLYESWRLLNKAVQLKDEVIDLAGVHLWDCYSNCLKNLESYISSLNPNGVKALENWIIEHDQHHTSWKPPLWLQKIQEDRLLLSVNPIFSNCREEYRDEIIFESMITPLTEEEDRRFKTLCHTFNNIKEDFATARYLYYQSQSQSPELVQVSSITSYINTLDFSDFGIRSGFLKTSLRLSADLLDKCAVFLTGYLQLPHPEDQVTFGNVWYQKRKHKQGLLEEIKTRLTANQFLSALYDLQRDLFANSYPFPFKTLRNNSTHKRMVLSWYGSLDEEIENCGLEIFQEATFQLLRMAKAAIIYLVGLIMLEEQQKPKNHSKDKLCNLYFETDMGISDQEWLEIQK